MAGASGRRCQWLLLAILVEASVASGTRAQAPSQDLGSYVFFADQALHTNGVKVSAGNIGVGAGELVATGDLLAPTSQVAADSVRFEPDSTCASLFANHVKRAVPGCGPAAPFSNPVPSIPTACGFPDPFPACGTVAVTVDKGSSQTLSPGTYGDVRVKNNGGLTLQGGDYVFCSLHLSRNARLLVEGASRINVAGDVAFSDGSRVGPGKGSEVAPCDVDFFVNGTDVGIEQQADIQGRLCAPSAELHVNHGGTLVGSFAALSIFVHRVAAQGCPVAPTTSTSSSTTSSSTTTGSTSSSTTQSSTTTTAPVSTTTTTSVSTTTSSSTTTSQASTTSTIVETTSTSTTATPSTTTSSASTSSTSSTTTTTLGTGPTRIPEICGNCIDDDGNGLTDFEDPACCVQSQVFTMSLSRGRIRPRGTTSLLRVRSLLGGAALSSAVNPLQQDVFVQIRPAGTTDVFCAHVPASHFMRMHGAFKFWDRHHAVASAKGIDDLTIKIGRDGSVRLRTVGRRAEFASPPEGQLQVTVGFRNAATAEAGNRCSTTTQAFRTGRRGALLAP